MAGPDRELSPAWQKLGASAMRMLHEVERSIEHGRAEATLAKLTEMTGFCRSSVRRAVRQAEALGFVDISLGPRRVGVFALEIKQREFMGAAQTHVAKGTTMLSDAIEQRLEDVIDRVPWGSEVHPLIASTVHMALATALDALTQKWSRRRSQ
jgi:hypothetical protein